MSQLVVWQPSLIGRALGRVRLRSLDSPASRDSAAVRQCTNQECRALLPRNVDYAALCTVQLMGGADVDIHGFLERLHLLLEERAALSRYGVRVLPARPEPDRSPSHRARVSQLVVPDRGRQRAVNLALHADCAEGGGSAPSGLILLVDPSSLPGVLGRLPGRQRPLRPDPVGDVADRLRAEARRRWRQQGRREGETVPTPLAVAIRRPELLRQVGHALGVPTADLHGAELAPNKFEALLSALEGDPLIDACHLFARRAYHMLPADGEGDAMPELEPLRWILSQLRMLPAGAATARTA